MFIKKNIEKNRPVFWFLSFLAHSEEKKDTVTALRPILETYLNEPCHMLDLGCGDGEFSAQLLADAPKNLHYNAIDESEHLLFHAQKNLEKLGFTHLKFIQDHWQTGLHQLKQQFDLILASHIGYYCDDMADFLATLRQHLTATGTAILVHETQDAFPNRMRQKYRAPLLTNITEHLPRCQIEKEIISWITPASNNWEKALYAPYDQLIGEEKELRHLLEFCVQKPAETLQEEGMLEQYIQDVEAEYQLHQGRFYLPSLIQFVSNKPPIVDHLFS